MATFVDENGQRQQVNLTENGMMFHYAAAQKNGVSLRQWINSQYATEPGKPDAFSQMCIGAGLRFKKNEETGQPAANLMEVLNPLAATNQTGGGHTNYPQIPDSRLLFPAAVMEAVNAALETKENEAMGAFAELIAQTDTIASDRWEQAVISYDGKKGPEDSAWRRTAQNAPPPLMLNITAADVTRTVPSRAIGLSISHKVLQNNALDMIGRTLVHFTKKADYNEWVSWFLLILQGDPDATNTSMATAKSALTQVKANVYDTTIAAAGELSHTAWLKYNFQDNLYAGITHAVTDYNGVLAIENRTDRPTVMHSSPAVNRFDRDIEVIFPSMSAAPLRVLRMPSAASWPANTIMGLDKNEAIGKVISSTADYQAVEDLVMLRTTNYRFDRGILLYRLYDTAFSTLSLTL